MSISNGRLMERSLAPLGMARECWSAAYRPTALPPYHLPLTFSAMQQSARAFLLAAALAGGLAPARASAQASAYIALDDPSLPLLEHLIARGDIEDPSPMVRPFRRVDAARVLAAADTAGASGRTLIQRLR